MAGRARRRKRPAVEGRGRSTEEAPRMTIRPLRPGDPAPWLTLRTAANPSYVLASAAGRWLLLAFLASAAQPRAAEALRLVERLRPRLDADRLAFLGVSVDPRDLEQGRLQDALPGIRFVHDHDQAMSRAFGVAGERDGRAAYLPAWILLDPQLRVAATVPMDAAGEHVRRVERLVLELPEVEEHAGVPIHAPVLILPRVLEPELCRALIEHYEQQGGKESGFMRDQDGKTVHVLDAAHKRRADAEIVDPALRGAVQDRVRRRIVPEIARAFQFEATRMERYIVACYDAREGGHFRPHRDNTTLGTAHRRFAVSLNLNAEGYEGGDLLFPEFGRRPYRAPTGGAVVFACSLLHEVRPVTAGRRYACLPFLYDEAAARLRERNARHLADGSGYRAEPAAPTGG